MIWRGTGRPI